MGPAGETGSINIIRVLKPLHGDLHSSYFYVYRCLILTWHIWSYTGRKAPPSDKTFRRPHISYFLGLFIRHISIDIMIGYPDSWFAHLIFQIGRRAQERGITLFEATVILFTKIGPRFTFPNSECGPLATRFPEKRKGYHIMLALSH